MFGNIISGVCMIGITNNRNAQIILHLRIRCVALSGQVIFVLFREFTRFHRIQHGAFSTNINICCWSQNFDVYHCNF